MSLAVLFSDCWAMAMGSLALPVVDPPPPNASAQLAVEGAADVAAAGAALLPLAENASAQDAI
jgi:hypothetical protein